MTAITDRKCFQSLRSVVLCVLALVLMAGSLDACSGAASRGATNTPSSAADSEHLPTPYSFPLDAYSESARQRSTLVNGKNKLVAQCAQRFGVRFEPDTSYEFSNDEWYLVYFYDLRPESYEQAAKFGYHTVTSRYHLGANPFAHISARGYEVVQGWHAGDGFAKPRSSFLLDGGCQSASFEAIYGRASSPNDPNGTVEDRNIRFVDNLIQRSIKLAEADPRYLHLLHRWTECMSAAGYSGTTSTTKAIGAFSVQGPPSRSELKQARADASCKQQVSLIPVFATLVRRFQEELIITSRAVLTRVRAELMAWLGAAEKALRH